jgi:hypothetical protein
MIAAESVIATQTADVNNSLTLSQDQAALMLLRKDST